MELYKDNPPVAVMIVNWINGGCRTYPLANQLVLSMPSAIPARIIQFEDTGGVGHIINLDVVADISCYPYDVYLATFDLGQDI